MSLTPGTRLATFPHTLCREGTFRNLPLPEGRNNMALIGKKKIIEPYKRFMLHIKMVKYVHIYTHKHTFIYILYIGRDQREEGWVPSCLY